MDPGFGTYGVAFAAGALSTLSPCVLPLVPILIGAAVSTHRRGTWALAAGLALSFTLVGGLLAGLGASIGLEPEVYRNVAAMLLLAFGVLILSTRAQAALGLATSGVSGVGQEMLSRMSVDGLSGLFLLGLLLGVVWMPCVGPTLGVAITLAGRGERLAEVMPVMGLFGVGAALPLVALGALSQRAIARSRGYLLAAGRHGRQVLAAVILIVSVAILTGADKRIEAWVLDAAPGWLTELGTRL